MQLGRISQTWQALSDVRPQGRGYFLWEGSDSLVEVTLDNNKIREQVNTWADKENMELNA